MRIEDEQDGKGFGGWQHAEEVSAQPSLTNATNAALTVQS